MCAYTIACAEDDLKVFLSFQESSQQRGSNMNDSMSPCEEFYRFLGYVDHHAPDLICVDESDVLLADDDAPLASNGSVLLQQLHARGYSVHC
eukprot:2214611-Amphidinium_carterae.1